MRKHVTFGDVYFPPIMKFEPIVTGCNGEQIQSIFWFVNDVYKQNTYLFLLIMLNKFKCDISDILNPDFSTNMEPILHSIFNNEYECMMCGGLYDSTPTSEIVYKHMENCSYAVGVRKRKK